MSFLGKTLCTLCFENIDILSPATNADRTLLQAVVILAQVIGLVRIFLCKKLIV